MSPDMEEQIARRRDGGVSRTGGLDEGMQGRRAGMSEISFFFFQAEDGIRDADVTGVQTCALPISLTKRVPKPLVKVAGRPVMDYVMDTVAGLDLEELIVITGHLKEQVEQYVTTHYKRSEERRVGKECRSRWSPYH